MAKNRADRRWIHRTSRPANEDAVCVDKESIIGKVIFCDEDETTVYFLQGAPHIHLHYVINEDFKQCGFSIHEIMCHACGRCVHTRSSLSVEPREEETDRHLRIRAWFYTQHAGCVGMSLCNECPTWDKTLKRVDPGVPLRIFDERDEIDL